MRGKMDEAFRNDNQRMIELGRQNVKCIEGAKAWCKHFRVEMTSSGMLAAATGLPIGGHDISCQFAGGGFGGMNLPWIIPDFLMQYCQNCGHHELNGGDSWAFGVIEARRAAAKEQEREVERRKAQLTALRAELRTALHAAKPSSQQDQLKVLTFTEELFSDDSSKGAMAADLLVRAAELGPDLFAPRVVDILIDQSLSPAFSLSCLRILAELAGRRNDLSEPLFKAALENIRKNITPEPAAALLVRLGADVHYPLSSALISVLIVQQDHGLPVGGWPEGQPTYPNSIEVLCRCYDNDRESVLSPLRELLKHNETYFRINACGCTALLQKHRSQVGLDLLPALLSSLDLPDDTFDSADHRAKKCILEAFRHRPTDVDECLIRAIYAKRPAVQQEIIDIYSDLIHDSAPKRTESRTSRRAPPAEAALAIEHCLEFMKDEHLDLDVRRCAADAVKGACSDYPYKMLRYFDALLGYYALICPQDDAPPPPQRIILPGQDIAPKTPLRELEQDMRRDTWRRFRNILLESLEELAEAYPGEVGRGVINAFEGLDTRAHPDLKSAIVTLLGSVGKDYALQAAVLPPLKKALMDYESQVIRARAINAVSTIYEYSESRPPRDIIEMLVVHVYDQYAIVHDAAVRALSYRPHWLDEEQSVQVLYVILKGMQVSKAEPFALEKYCEAALEIAEPFPN